MAICAIVNSTFQIF